MFSTHDDTPRRPRPRGEQDNQTAVTPSDSVTTPTKDILAAFAPSWNPLILQRLAELGIDGCPLTHAQAEQVTTKCLLVLRDEQQRRRRPLGSRRIRQIVRAAVLQVAAEYYDPQADPERARRLGDLAEQWQAAALGFASDALKLSRQDERVKALAHEAMVRTWEAHLVRRLPDALGPGYVRKVVCNLVRDHSRLRPEHDLPEEIRPETDRRFNRDALDPAEVRLEVAVVLQVLRNKNHHLSHAVVSAAIDAQGSYDSAAQILNQRLPGRHWNTQAVRKEWHRAVTRLRSTLCLPPSARRAHRASKKNSENAASSWGADGVETV